MKVKVRRLENLTNKDKLVIRDHIKCLRWMRGFGIGVYAPETPEEEKPTIEKPSAKQFAVNVVVTLMVTAIVIGFLRYVGYLP